MSKPFLTVKEYAEQTGFTSQYVYKLIKNGKLSEFVEIRNGKKVIRSEALEQIQKEKEKEKPEPDVTGQQIFAVLQEQLRAKDEQIVALQTALQRSQDLLRTEQNIRYATERRILLLEGQLQTSVDKSTPEAEESILRASEDVTKESEMAAGATDPAEPGQQTSQEVGKRQVSIWQRIQRAIRGQDKT